MKTSLFLFCLFTCSTFELFLFNCRTSHAETYVVQRPAVVVPERVVYIGGVPDFDAPVRRFIEQRRLPNQVTRELVSGLSCLVPKVELVSVPVVKKKNYVEVCAVVTAYCPCQRCCGHWSQHGRTATGMSAWSPGIAVDPNAIPYGTSLSVPGYDRATWAPADDTGSFVKKRHKNPEVVYIDVRMKTHWQAREWGTQCLVIKVGKNCD